MPRTTHNLARLLCWTRVHAATIAKRMCEPPIHPSLAEERGCLPHSRTLLFCLPPALHGPILGLRPIISSLVYLLPSVCYNTHPHHPASLFKRQLDQYIGTLRSHVDDHCRLSVSCLEPSLDFTPRVRLDVPLGPANGGGEGTILPSVDATTPLSRRVDALPLRSKPVQAGARPASMLLRRLDSVPSGELI